MIAVIELARSHDHLCQAEPENDDPTRLQLEVRNLRESLAAENTEKLAAQTQAATLTTEVAKLKEDILHMARARGTASPAPVATSSSKSKAKFPDPPRFSNNKSLNFRAWKANVLNKLRIEARSYELEQDKIAYIFSRTEGEANQHMIPRMDETSPLAYQTADDVIKHLTQVFSNPFMKEKALTDYFRLRMFSNESFEDFYSRFTKVATEAEVPATSWFHDLWMRLTNTLQLEIQPIKTTLNENVEQLASVCRAQDHIRQNQKQNVERRKNTTSYNSVRANASSASSTQNPSLPNKPVKKAKPDIKKEPDEEKERFLKEGLCFKCENKGHLARDCPSKGKPNLNALKVGSSKPVDSAQQSFTEEILTDSSDSENE
ncbi:hypothetical protein DIS24_g10595 [Lasiodiplodia hormozganensis]|uniref:CCHC-type domain-containing protein n=1 Tax=Lasiodiplodia hormozganensis TaxID=869390 RepID=A0AA39XPE7_9PEZI|nr:hypothetical protein DIS24_g10595 [Lasiodiplodia hormozganensis]